MTERTDCAPQSRVFVYHGSLPPLLALLVAAPLLLMLLSVAAAVLAGGAVAAVFLPLFLRRRGLRAPRDTDAIELTPDQYSKVDDTPAPRLPGRPAP
jgi:hypothetical protein